MPAGVIKCDRSGKGTWGNPFPVGGRDQHGHLIEDGAHAVRAYQAHIDCMLDTEMWGVTMPYLDEMRRTLRGKDLACWCAEDAPCHVDVILKVANG